MKPAIMIFSARGGRVLSTEDDMGPLLELAEKFRKTSNRVRIAFGKAYQDHFEVDSYDDLNGYCAAPPSRIIQLTSFETIN